MPNGNDGPGFEPIQVAPNAAYLPGQPDDEAVFLTLMPKGYDRNRKRIEVSANMPFLYGPDGAEGGDGIPHYTQPGVTIQAVEGCGYDVDSQIAPEAAEALASVIERDRIWTSGFPRQYFMTQDEANRVAAMLRAAAKESVEAHRRTPNLAPDDEIDG